VKAALRSGKPAEAKTKKNMDKKSKKSLLRELRDSSEENLKKKKGKHSKDNKIPKKPSKGQDLTETLDDAAAERGKKFFHRFTPFHILKYNLYVLLENIIINSKN